MHVNLKHAAWSKQEVRIAGGVFTPAECADAARKLEAFDDMLAALEEALEYIGDVETDDSLEARRTRATVRTAIARARGEG